MAYTHAKKITFTSVKEPRPTGYKWVKSRPQYIVRTDAGAMSTRHDDAKTLTEARKIGRAHIRAGRTTWCEIFRWAETGVSLKRFMVEMHERELSA